jgi:chitin disaccharide deacetylase
VSGTAAALRAQAIILDASSGLLIVNADDWGRDRLTTDRTLDCVGAGSVSSVSAMVFMDDSARAAAIARERRIESGLHLNLTTAFSASACPAPLRERQQRIARYLQRHRLSQVGFHPGLARDFAYVVAAQLAEFARLYGRAPDRIDGHHHMHLCANVLLAGLLPGGTLVRRSFSFQPGEKSSWNRLYRRGVDALIARRHRTFDFFLSLEPLDSPVHLQRIVCLARRFIVEVETHPVIPQEYHFLTRGRWSQWRDEIRIAPPRSAPAGWPEERPK